MKTFRQASLVFFMLLSGQLLAQGQLYDELTFLSKASEQVEVFLPGTSPKIEDDVTFIEDSISTGQAGLQKRPAALKKQVAPSKNRKRLRYRSR